MNIFAKILIIYFVIINIVTFALWGIDKWKAKKGKRRISENTLLLWSLAGGFVGALAGTNVFRHKTIKGKFLIWFYSICFLWIILLILFLIYGL